MKIEDNLLLLETALGTDPICDPVNREKLTEFQLGVLAGISQTTQWLRNPEDFMPPVAIIGSLKEVAK